MTVKKVEIFHNAFFDVMNPKDYIKNKLIQEGFSFGNDAAKIIVTENIMNDSIIYTQEIIDKD